MVTPRGPANGEGRRPGICREERWIRIGGGSRKNCLAQASGQCVADRHSASVLVRCVVGWFSAVSLSYFALSYLLENFARGFQDLHAFAPLRPKFFFLNSLQHCSFGFLFKILQHFAFLLLYRGIFLSGLNIFTQIIGNIICLLFRTVFQNFCLILRFHCHILLF